MNKILVLLPTLNEAGNILPLLDRIYLSVPDSHVLVVDDSSSDGTAELVKSRPEYNTALFLIERTGTPGRGLAGRDGFLWACQNQYSLIIEMDADFSHDPAYLPALVNAAHNSDFVIGSRYVSGGSDNRIFAIRQLISRCANLYIRTALGLWGIHDCTSGFRLFRRHVLEAVSLSTLRSRDPAIVEEVLFRAVNRGYFPREIPIRFHDRNAGVSQLTVFKLFKILIFILRLRFSE